MRTPTTETADEQILELLLADHSRERGFRLLLEKYQERLYWHVRRLVIEHQDANDVIQNCLIKVYRNIGQFEGKSALYTWLYRIATNESITFLNRKKRKSVQAIGDEQLNLANRLQADPYFDGAEAQRRLQLALQTLPEKQKAVFNLRYYEEMSYREMSEVLDTSVGALKASYHHAVKKVEHYFRNHDHDA